jgi:hypothetical protein
VIFPKSIWQDPGVLGRSEFGLEIVIALAYQVYCRGLSMDKACAILCFFQQLKLYELAEVLGSLDR